MSTTEKLGVSIPNIPIWVNMHFLNLLDYLNKQTIDRLDHKI